MNTGERIRERRIELGWTQEELAKKMGYKSKSTINKIEMGINDLTQSKIRKFAKVMTTTVERLMGWDDDQVPNSGQIEEYYLDDDARELAEFLHKNPEYKVLFDASRNVRREDIEFVKQMIERMS